jgi:hypothetical protein
MQKFWRKSTHFFGRPFQLTEKNICTYETAQLTNESEWVKRFKYIS